MPAIPEDMVVEMTLATPDTRVTFHLPTRHSTGTYINPPAPGPRFTY